MINKKRLSKRIDAVQVDIRDLRRGYTTLLDERSSISREMRHAFDRELAQYKSAMQDTQTDRIKFEVLEEWIREVFALNKLKFSDKDFVDAVKKDIVEQEIREQIALELEKEATAAMISNEYNFNDTAVRAKTYRHAAEIVRGKNEV
jgi:hypothetical protein